MSKFGFIGLIYPSSTTPAPQAASPWTENPVLSATGPGVGAGGGGDATGAGAGAGAIIGGGGGAAGPFAENAAPAIPANKAKTSQKTILPFIFIPL
jgi:hypothetical protein